MAISGLQRKTMDEESNDNIESINDETEEVFNTEEVEETVADTETEDESEEDIEAIKEQNKKLFERAKKAEAELKKAKASKPAPAPSAPSEKQDGLTPLDTLALFNAKVTSKEDIETVQKFARIEGLSIEDALSDSIVQNILKTRAEERATAAASNTSTARRGTSKPSLDQVLSNAETGKLPDDPELLAEARLAAKYNK